MKRSEYNRKVARLCGLLIGAKMSKLRFAWKLSRVLTAIVALSSLPCSATPTVLREYGAPSNEFSILLPGKPRVSIEQNKDLKAATQVTQYSEEGLDAKIVSMKLQPEDRIASLAAVYVNSLKKAPVETRNISGFGWTGVLYTSEGPAIKGSVNYQYDLFSRAAGTNVAYKITVIGTSRQTADRIIDSFKVRPEKAEQAHQFDKAVLALPSEPANEDWDWVPPGDVKAYFAVLLPKGQIDSHPGNLIPGSQMYSSRGYQIDIAPLKKSADYEHFEQIASQRAVSSIDVSGHSATNMLPISGNGWQGNMYEISVNGIPHSAVLVARSNAREYAATNQGVPEFIAAPFAKDSIAILYSPVPFQSPHGRRFFDSLCYFGDPDVISLAETISLSVKGVLLFVGLLVFPGLIIRRCVSSRSN